MSKVSSRQQAILEFIRSEVRLKGYPPSVREIGEAVGLASSSTVHGHLDRLEKKGFIRRDPTKPRAIELLGQDDAEGIGQFAHSVARVPVIGKVTAGVPITATENIEDYFPLPQHYAGEGEIFMLSVVGNSMIEAGIHSGDYVIVRKQQTANNGEIVVAMTEDDEATVKTFYKEKDHIRLQPENSTMEPLRLTHVTILGKVIGLFRDLH
ncbi:transcriptional repressor LexA [Paenibacillus woosongensis]|uniref:LexA repressor n=1 Tax=Paenibacillus woosongensis TaxID=307580 RepID=A0A7X3CQT9_9BACL|nr:transcriptional repressor LexA [Paenibacillus woosongensis]MUG47562.1 transcriptional repressor LexA [Paenibacillus woosongensis]WHX47164.1 transcriptional repressor LexA [Paenibacillus woosongensis]GIP59363.1 LexA repressor [Paenibacillus woosongensis]